MAASTPQDNIADATSSSRPDGVTLQSVDVVLLSSTATPFAPRSPIASTTKPVTIPPAIAPAANVPSEYTSNIEENSSGTAATSLEPTKMWPSVPDSFSLHTLSSVPSSSSPSSSSSLSSLSSRTYSELTSRNTNSNTVGDTTGYNILPAPSATNVVGSHDTENLPDFVPAAMPASEIKTQHHHIRHQAYTKSNKGGGRAYFPVTTHHSKLKRVKLHERACRLLLLSSQVSPIIGRGGKTVERLRADCGVAATVLAVPHKHIPHRVLCLVGTFDNIIKALRRVAELLSGNGDELGSTHAGRERERENERLRYCIHHVRMGLSNKHMSIFYNTTSFIT